MAAVRVVRRSVLGVEVVSLIMRHTDPLRDAPGGRVGFGGVREDFGQPERVEAKGERGQRSATGGKPLPTSVTGLVP